MQSDPIFWNRFVEQNKIAIIRHSDPNLADGPRNILSLAWVRTHRDDIITVEMISDTQKEPFSAGLPLSHIDAVLPLPISTLYQAQPPVSQRKKIQRMVKGKLKEFQEPVSDYFRRFVIPFVKGGGIAATFEANQAEVIHAVDQQAA